MVPSWSETLFRTILGLAVLVQPVLVDNILDEPSNRIMELKPRHRTVMVEVLPELLHWRYLLCRRLVDGLVEEPGNRNLELRSRDGPGQEGGALHIEVLFQPTLMAIVGVRSALDGAPLKPHRGPTGWHTFEPRRGPGGWRTFSV